MDAATVKVYETHAKKWIAARRADAIEDGRLDALAHLEPTAAELARGEGERRFPSDRLPGRLFSAHLAIRVRALLVGAGFTVQQLQPLADRFWLWVRARRARSLPDLVGPGLRLLI